MSSVKPDDLLRFVEGEIQDADELDRIEAALETDPALAAEFDQLAAAFEPAPDVMEDVRGMFQALDASVWARLQYSAEAASSGNTEQASLELPDGQTISVVLRATADGVSLEMTPRPRGWRAASVALFHARVVGGGPMEVSGGEETRVSPVSRTAGKRGKRQPIRAPKAAFQMSAEHEHRGWMSDPAKNPDGAKAWLKETAFGVELFVRLPESSSPAKAAHFRLRWKDPPRKQEREETGSVQLVQRQGRLVGREQLEVRLDELLKTPRWCLRVEPIAGEHPPHLDASQFRSVVGDDFQTLILNAASGQPKTKATAPSATFQNERQRAMWNDRGITRWVRFERA